MRKGLGPFVVGRGFGGEEEGSRGSGGFTDCGNGLRTGEGGPGSAVVGGELGVGHEDADGGEGQVEFFGGGLGEDGSGALAEFGFSGEEG